MQGKTNRLVRVAAIATGLGMAAFTASAAEGNFNLPVEAHWGHVVLEPGLHAVQIPAADSGQKIVYLHTGTQTKLTVPMTSQPAVGNRAYLRLVKVNGAYYVDAYQSQLDGRKYFFSHPKTQRVDEAGASADEATLIEVDSK